MTNARNLLDMWEAGLRQPLQERILTLLAGFRPEYSRDALAALPVGERDAMLLDMREVLFGDRIATLAECPGCGDRLEAGFSIRDFRSHSPPVSGKALTLKRGARRIGFRLPTTEDLLAIPEHASPSEAQTILFERCVTGVTTIQRTSANLDRLASTVAAAMTKADPRAETQLSLTCPECGISFTALFDIGIFLLQEINAWAQRMLRDIASLAQAFGWSEEQICGLNPTRRQFYLQSIEV